MRSQSLSTVSVRTLTKHPQRQRRSSRTPHAHSSLLTNARVLPRTTQHTSNAVQSYKRRPGIDKTSIPPLDNSERAKTVATNVRLAVRSSQSRIKPSKQPRPAVYRGTQSLDPAEDVRLHVQTTQILIISSNATELGDARGTSPAVGTYQFGTRSGICTEMICANNTFKCSIHNIVIIHIYNAYHEHKHNDFAIF